MVPKVYFFQVALVFPRTVASAFAEPRSHEIQPQNEWHQANEKNGQ